MASIQYIFIKDKLWVNRSGKLLIFKTLKNGPFFTLKKKLVLDLEQLLHNFYFFWLNIEFLYQNYGLMLLETSNLFGPWLMDIFVSLGLSQVDIIVSLKMACSWSTTTFYIISASFLPKIDERKNWIFWRKLWTNPFCKNTIFWHFEKWTFVLV